MSSGDMEGVVVFWFQLCALALWWMGCKEGCVLGNALNKIRNGKDVDDWKQWCECYRKMRQMNVTLMWPQIFGDIAEDNQTFEIDWI